MNWKLLFTPKFVHALVVDLTNAARTLIVAYILWTANPKYAYLLFAVVTANFLAKILLNRVYQKEQEEQVKLYAQAMKQMTDQVERRDVD